MLACLCDAIVNKIKPCINPLNWYRFIMIGCIISGIVMLPYNFTKSVPPFYSHLSFVVHEQPSDTHWWTVVSAFTFILCGSTGIVCSLFFSRYFEILTKMTDCALIILIVAFWTLRPTHHFDRPDVSVIRESLLDTINSTELEYIEQWDNLQTTYNCCGVDHWMDWVYSIRGATQPNHTPRSCCNGDFRNIMNESIPIREICYTGGCLPDILVSFYDHQMHYIFNLIRSYTCMTVLICGTLGYNILTRFRIWAADPYAIILDNFGNDSYNAPNEDVELVENNVAADAPHEE